MIQELFGGAGLIGGEKKFPTILEGTPSPSSSCSSTSTTTPTTAAATSSTLENLICPRCDSTNTKFCYYNNYNLTQPRHFCRTCRRYWTKGGALRNVPIGGGCRKNRSTSVSASVGKPSISKMKNLASEIGRSGIGNEFAHELSFSPIIWSAPQDSHVLALLRGNQNHNPNPGALSSSISVKKEGVIIGTHLITEPTSVATGEPNSRILYQDPLGQVPSLGLSNPFGKNCPNQAQPHQNGFLVDEAPDSGLRELYQRLTFSANYYAENSPVILGNAASSSTSASSAVLESAPVDGGEGVLGNWNPAFSWSDFQN